MSDLLDDKSSVICHAMIKVSCPWQQKLLVAERLRAQRRHILSFALFIGIWSMSFLNVAYAGNLSLLVNGKSLHLNPPRNTEYNEENWGVGVQYDIESFSKKWVPFLTASGFIDSFENASYYTGAGLVRRIYLDQQKDGKHFDAGLIGFFMTRKDFKDGNPFFGMLPALSIGTRRYAVNLTYIPKVDPKMVALWFFQFKISVADF